MSELESARPTISDLPFMQYTEDARVYMFADLPIGARVAYVPAGQIVGETLHTAVIPVGSMLVVIEPKIAATLRPLKVAQHGPLDVGTAPIVEVGPLKIPILVDAQQDLEAIITLGVVPGGEPWPNQLPILPAGCMVALFPPEFANQVRTIMQHTMAAIAQAQKAEQGHGSPFH